MQRDSATNDRHTHTVNEWISISTFDVDECLLPDVFKFMQGVIKRDLYLDQEESLKRNIGSEGEKRSTGERGIALKIWRRRELMKFRRSNNASYARSLRVKQKWVKRENPNGSVSIAIVSQWRYDNFQRLYDRPRHTSAVLFCRNYDFSRRWATRCRRTSFTKYNPTQKIFPKDFHTHDFRIKYIPFQIFLSISVNGFLLVKSLSFFFFRLNMYQS